MPISVADIKNPLRARTELFRLNILNIIVADALATQGARPSAAMILTVK